MIGTMKKTTPRARRTTGFTLIEIVMVLLIFGIVVAMAAAITRGVAASQKRSLTTTRMAGVDAALVQFVQQQRRLPCPGDGTKASSDNNAGVEMRAAGACTANQQNGVVPWRTLALTETDATDGWDRRLTYRLDPALGLDGGMDISWCDPAGTKVVVPPALCSNACLGTDMTTCTRPVDFLRGRGLTVRNVAGTAVLMDPQASPSIIPPTGAAYVLVSHGESGGGAYLNSGTLAASAVGEGNEEMKNFASLPYTVGVTYYVDDSLQEAPGVNHFDDVMSRPSISSVSSKAGVGPRSH